MTIHLKVLLATAAFALAACSGAAGAPEPPEAPETSATGESSGTDSAATADHVAIDDFAFRPETVTVPVGTTITWSNEDPTSHTVTAGGEDDPDPDTFDLPFDEQGQTVQFTFDEAGTYAYYCELHPFMTGVVEVTQ